MSIKFLEGGRSVFDMQELRRMQHEARKMIKDLKEEHLEIINEMISEQADEIYNGGFLK